MSNEVDDFLKGVKGGEETNDPFAQESKDPFENVSSKKEEVVEEEVDEKPLPFHKDPKVAKFIEKEISKRLAEMPSAEKEFKEEITDKEDKITDVLTRIIGNDTPEKLSAIKEFREVLLEREDKGAEKALKYFEEQKVKEQAVYQEAENEVEQGFERIEEQFGVDLDAPNSAKTRNDFIDFVQRISPKDREGNIVEYPDFTETFSVFQEMNKKPASNSRAKELASKSISRGTDASQAPVTGDKSWKAVEKFFNNLSS